MADVKRQSGRAIWTLGKGCREFWNALHPEEFQTLKQVMAATGRASSGGQPYLSLISNLVLFGQAEMRTIRTAGRPRKEYRRTMGTFYNTMKDGRFNYVPWNELPNIVQMQARDRYEGQYPWLKIDEWLYPITRAKDASGRLGRAERVLAGTVAAAEEARLRWRKKNGGDFL